MVFAGTEPGAVWRSTDRGETFRLEQALWDHPHRPEWGEGFGGQAFHTILPHPSDPASVTAALSTGGVYQTADGGKSWEPRNQGIRAEFLPEGQQYPEFGQCVHKVARHPARPERLFLQNHGGVYRSDDHGASWQYIADGLPADFGFSIVVHPHEPDTIYVFPIGGGDGRYPPGAKARVWRSRDAGGSWEELGNGLPDSFYVAVMRDAMCADDHDTPGHLLRCPQRQRLGVGRRGGHLAAGGQRPPRRAGGPGCEGGGVSHFEVTRSVSRPGRPGPRARPDRRLPRVDRLVPVGGRRPRPAAHLHRPAGRGRCPLRLAGQPQGRPGVHGDHRVDTGADRRPADVPQAVEGHQRGRVRARARPASGTDVTWRMWGENTGMAAMFTKVFNMDKLVGKDFEKGLARLKAVAETPA